MDNSKLVVMDVMHSCQCCLRCPPDKDLKTPYIHLGKTEIYSDMLEECFGLQIIMTLDGDGQHGICKECVSHLRDASNFKLQVQHSQAKLQALLVKDEPIVKPEPEMDILEETDEESILSPVSRPEDLGSANQTFIKIESTETHKLTENNTDVSNDMKSESTYYCGRSFGNSEDNDMETVTHTEMETAQVGNLLPLKSRMKYKKAYEQFISWKNEKKAKRISESVLLEYFEELSKTFKSSTLWGIYSMLKATINVEHNINIKLYSKLTTLLKRLSSGFYSKKSNVLTAENVEKFLREAPDEIYLATKVALIFGVNGACRAAELVDIKTSDIEEYNNMILIKLANTKTQKDRSFVIRDEFLNIVQKYQNLRPETEHDRFFLNYSNGKCNKQPIGRHKLADTPKKIAMYLKLPNPECYTGHCFRRTSATLFADSGADLNTLKRHGGWASNKIAEGYIEESVKKKVKRNHTINEAINLNSGPSISRTCPTTSNEYILPPSPLKSSDSLSVEMVQNTKNILLSVKNCPNSFINFNFK